MFGGSTPWNDFGTVRWTAFTTTFVIRKKKMDKLSHSFATDCFAERSILFCRFVRVMVTASRGLLKEPSWVSTKLANRIWHSPRYWAALMFNNWRNAPTILARRCWLSVLGKICGQSRKGMFHLASPLCPNPRPFCPRSGPIGTSQPKLWAASHEDFFLFAANPLLPPHQRKPRWSMACEHWL